MILRLVCSFLFFSFVTGDQVKGRYGYSQTIKTQPAIKTIISSGSVQPIQTAIGSSSEYIGPVQSTMSSIIEYSKPVQTIISSSPEYSETLQKIFGTHIKESLPIQKAINSKIEYTQPIQTAITSDNIEHIQSPVNTKIEYVSQPVQPDLTSSSEFIEHIQKPIGSIHEMTAPIGKPITSIQELTVPIGKPISSKIEYTQPIQMGMSSGFEYDSQHPILTSSSEYLEPIQKPLSSGIEYIKPIQTVISPEYGAQGIEPVLQSSSEYIEPLQKPITSKIQYTQTLPTGLGLNPEHTQLISTSLDVNPEYTQPLPTGLGSNSDNTEPIQTALNPSLEHGSQPMEPVLGSSSENTEPIQEPISSRIQPDQPISARIKYNQPINSRNQEMELESMDQNFIEPKSYEVDYLPDGDQGPGNHFTEEIGDEKAICFTPSMVHKMIKAALDYVSETPTDIPKILDRVSEDAETEREQDDVDNGPLDPKKIYRMILGKPDTESRNNVVLKYNLPGVQTKEPSCSDALDKLIDIAYMAYKKLRNHPKCKDQFYKSRGFSPEDRILNIVSKRPPSLIKIVQHPQPIVDRYSQPEYELPTPQLYEFNGPHKEILTYPNSLNQDKFSFDGPEFIDPSYDKPHAADTPSPEVINLPPNWPLINDPGLAKIEDPTTYEIPQTYEIPPIRGISQTYEIPSSPEYNFLAPDTIKIGPDYTQIQTYGIRPTPGKSHVLNLPSNWPLINDPGLAKFEGPTTYEKSQTFEIPQIPGISQTYKIPSSPEDVLTPDTFEIAPGYKKIQTFGIPPTPGKSHVLNLPSNWPLINDPGLAKIEGPTTYENPQTYEIPSSPEDVLTPDTVKIGPGYKKIQTFRIPPTPGISQTYEIPSSPEYNVLTPDTYKIGPDYTQIQTYGIRPTPGKSHVLNLPPNWPLINDPGLAKIEGPTTYENTQTYEIPPIPGISQTYEIPSSPEDVPVPDTVKIGPGYKKIQTFVIPPTPGISQTYEIPSSPEDVLSPDIIKIGPGYKQIQTFGVPPLGKSNVLDIPGVSQTYEIRPTETYGPQIFEITPDYQKIRTPGISHTFEIPPNHGGPQIIPDYKIPQTFGTPSNPGKPGILEISQIPGTLQTFGIPPTYGKPQTFDVLPSHEKSQPFMPSNYDQTLPLNRPQVIHDEPQTFGVPNRADDDEPENLPSDNDMPQTYEVPQDPESSPITMYPPNNIPIDMPAYETPSLSSPSYEITNPYAPQIPGTPQIQELPSEIQKINLRPHTTQIHIPGYGPEIQEYRISQNPEMQSDIQNLPLQEITQVYRFPKTKYLTQTPEYEPSQIYEIDPSQTNEYDPTKLNKISPKIYKIPLYSKQTPHTKQIQIHVIPHVIPQQHKYEVPLSPQVYKLTIPHTYEPNVQYQEIEYPTGGQGPLLLPKPLVQQDVDDDDISNRFTDDVIQQNKHRIDPKLYDALIRLVRIPSTKYNPKLKKLILLLLDTNKNNPLTRPGVIEDLVPLLVSDPSGFVDPNIIDIIMNVKDPQLLKLLLLITNPKVRPQIKSTIINLIRQLQGNRLPPNEFGTLLSLLLPYLEDDKIIRDIAVPQTIDTLARTNEKGMDPKHRHTIIKLIKMLADGSVPRQIYEIINRLFSPIYPLVSEFNDNILSFLHPEQGLIDPKRIELIHLILLLSENDPFHEAARVFLRLLREKGPAIMKSPFVTILLGMDRINLLTPDFFSIIIDLMNDDVRGLIPEDKLKRFLALLERYRDSHPDVIADITRLLRQHTDNSLTPNRASPEGHTELDPLGYGPAPAMVHAGSLGPQHYQPLNGPNDEFVKVFKWLDNQGLLNPDDPLSNKLMIEKILKHLGDRGSGVVELTYMLKHEKPVIYQPVYYVKYRLPILSFISNMQNLIHQQPRLTQDPVKLLQELIVVSNVTEVSPNLQGYPKDEIVKLTVNEGDLVQAKILDQQNVNFNDQISMVHNLVQDISPQEILQLNKRNEAKYYPSAVKIGVPPVIALHELIKYQDGPRYLRQGRKRVSARSGQSRSRSNEEEKQSDNNAAESSS